MLNFPIGSSTPSRYRGIAGDGSSSPFELFIAPALREGVKICLLLTAFWIPDGKGLAKDLALSLGKAKALSKAIPITEKTGLSERQIKSYRLNLWIEGVHFKHLTALGETDNSKGLLWYNYPKINQLVQDA